MTLPNIPAGREFVGRPRLTAIILLALTFVAPLLALIVGALR